MPRQTPASKPHGRRRLKRDRKEALIKVLVTEGMKRRFSTAAESRGMTVSAWMRSIALREVDAN